MAKIVLSGGPFSGKSKLASDLADELKGRDRYVAIIDESPESIAESYDFGNGIQGSYITDLAIAIDKIGQEFAFKTTTPDVDDIIVCGSIEESATYLAVNAELRQRQQDYAMAALVIPVFQLMRVTFGDAYTFLLPPGDDLTSYEEAVHSTIATTFEAFNTPYENLHPDFPELWVPFILERVFDIKYDDDTSEGTGEVDSTSGTE